MALHSELIGPSVGCYLQLPLVFSEGVDGVVELSVVFENVANVVDVGLLDR